MVGSALVELLCADPDYSVVLILGRRKPALNDLKISFIKTNFSGRELFPEDIKGDVLFCCLGTTIKKAGSKEAFREVDLNMPMILAHLAKEKAIPVFIAVSSLGAHTNSKNFYLRTKGQMEQEVLNAGVFRVVFARPSMLYGDRKETRIAEFIGKVAMHVVDLLLWGKFRKYRGIQGKTVAAALIELASQSSVIKYVESDQLAVYGKSYLEK